MQYPSFLRKRRVVDGLTQRAFTSLAEYPGVGDGAAADHNAVNTGLAESGDGLVSRSNVAAANDRYRDRALDLADYVPVGIAAVALDAGAAVNGDHRSAGALDYLCDLDGIDGAFVPAGTNLHGDGDRDCPRDSAEDLLELGQVAKQGRASAALYDSLGRASAVDVDDVGAGFLDRFSSHNHAIVVIAKDLNRQRPLFGQKPHHSVGAHVSAGQALDRYEFGDNQADTALFFDQASKRRIGDARHWRQNKVRHYFDCPNVDMTQSIH